MISEERILNLKKIVNVILIRKKRHRRLNRYEYYMLGGIPFRKGENTLLQLFKAGKINAYEYNVLSKYIDNELVFGASRNKAFILKTYYQFGNYVISNEEKQMIWNELNMLGLTDAEIDDLVFSAAVREYAKKNGLLPGKKLVKVNKVRGE